MKRIKSLFSHRSKPRFESLEQRAMLTTFFVDGAAAAGGTGGPSDPFDTIQGAIVAAEASGGPDSVNISPGVYEENLVIAAFHFI